MSSPTYTPGLNQENYRYRRALRCRESVKTAFARSRENHYGEPWERREHTPEQEKAREASAVLAAGATLAPRPKPLPRNPGLGRHFVNRFSGRRARLSLWLDVKCGDEVLPVAYLIFVDTGDDVYLSSADLLACWETQA